MWVIIDFKIADFINFICNQIRQSVADNVSAVKVIKFVIEV